MVARRDSVDSPELFIGLVGAVGTDLGAVKDRVTTSLKNYGYKCYEIRLSELLDIPFRELDGKKYGSEHERIAELMDYGDKLCEKLGRGDALAVLACAPIQVIRQDENQEVRRRAYILRSLKRPDEVLTLREIYGQAFHVVSAYSPREQRVRALSQRIAESVSSTESASYRNKAEQLIGRDQDEPDCEFGQNLRGTFPLADVFVDAADLTRL